MTEAQQRVLNAAKWVSRCDALGFDVFDPRNKRPSAQDASPWEDLVGAVHALTDQPAGAFDMVGRELVIAPPIWQDGAVVRAWRDGATVVMNEIDLPKEVDKRPLRVPRIDYTGTFWFWNNWTFGVVVTPIWEPNSRAVSLVLRLGPLTTEFVLTLREP